MRRIRAYIAFIAWQPSGVQFSKETFNEHRSFTAPQLPATWRTWAGHRALLVLSVAFAATTLTTPGFGQSWPAKPVKITTAASAGSGPDVSLRLIAEQLSRRWGHP